MKKSKKVTKKITQTRITETLNKVKRNKSIYEDEYLPADEEVIFHEGLEGLDVIKIRLPQPPDLKKIEGYDLPPLEQKFRYTELPPKLASLNAKNYLDVEDFWKEIEEDMDYFEDELPFILREWDRRKFGHWVFIKGKPTWIPPWQYMYLNYYGFINEIDGGKHPEYRDRDRKLFVGRWYAATTTEAPFKFKYWKEDEAPRYTSSEETVRKVEKKGYTVERNGYMVDMKVRTVMGTVEYKCRRSGYTSQCTNQGIEISSRMHKALFGLQSMTEDKAQELFEKQIIYGYKGYPFFFRPISENIVDPKRTMNFKPALKKSGTGNNKKLRIIKALYSEMTYGSSTVGYFDGSKLKYWLSDEFGKCLTKWTQVLMYDGSLKYVQDIVVGDKLRGDDNEPRIVTSTTTGKEMLYDIIPNKGERWGCNESHILSLKWCLTQPKVKAWSKDQTINISVRDFLKLPPSRQSHLMLYKVGCEYEEQQHFLDPYFLGVWLGDGGHKHTIIHNPEPEIEAYLQGMADKLGHKLTIKNQGTAKCKLLSFGIGQAKEGSIKKEMARLGLLGNKHIPDSYQFDSRENRLKLLAGLIDTDGHKYITKGGYMYTIIQKRKELAHQIYRLALGLGFSPQINPKKGTIKRPDGTKFVGDYWDVSIYGNELHEIPCLVERKKGEKIEVFHKNRRNPMRCGFKVEKKEVGEYFGFTITGNSLFLLGDHTVTHNTKEVDVLERTLVVRKAMSTGNNALIQGYSNQISTAGDLKTGGGSSAKRLAQLSHWGKRNDNGQTGTGFINLFIPSDEGLENQVDEWGFSKKEAARDSILNTWKAFEDAQDWTSLNEEMRQTPLEWKHNFITNSKQARFNIHIIGNQIAFLSTYDKPLTIKGRFAWRNNSTHGYDIKKLPTRQDFLSGKDEVVFIPQDDDDYDWEISWMPDKTQTNKFTYLQDENKIIPGNVNKATHGIDPFKYKEKTSSGAGSLGGGAIFRLFDGAVDSPYVNPQGINPETGDFNHVTNRFCATYLKRPSSNEFCEQQLMADLFFGIKAYVETNVTDAYKWYKERGFEDYMFFAIDIKTGEENKVAGSDTTTKIINAIFNAWADHISFNGSREVHIQPLEQCAEIDDSMNDYDLFTACGYALIQAGAMRPIEIEVPDMFDASDIFQFEEIS